MNTTANTGIFNFARLIEEAEALLLGEQAAKPSCTRCSDCITGGTETAVCARKRGAEKRAAIQQSVRSGAD